MIKVVGITEKQKDRKFRKGFTQAVMSNLRPKGRVRIKMTQNKIGPVSEKRMLKEKMTQSRN